MKYVFGMYDWGDVPRFAFILKQDAYNPARYGMYLRMSEQQYNSGSVASLVKQLNDDYAASQVTP